MNKEDIIRMAREADRFASSNYTKWLGPEVINTDWVVSRDMAFAALVAAAEREACAKVCDTAERRWFHNTTMSIAAKQNAAAIRARGNT